MEPGLGIAAIGEKAVILVRTDRETARTVPLGWWMRYTGQSCLDVLRCCRLQGPLTSRNRRQHARPDQAVNRIRYKQKKTGPRPRALLLLCWVGTRRSAL